MTETRRSRDAALVLGAAFLMLTLVAATLHVSDSGSRDGVVATNRVDGKPAEVVSTSNWWNQDWELQAVEQLPRQSLPEGLLAAARDILNHNPNSGSPARATGSTNRRVDERHRKRLVARNIESLEKLKDLEWPNVAKLRRIRIALHSTQPERTTLCWFISETKSTVTVLQNDLSIAVIPKVEGIEYGEVDYAAEINEIIEWMEATNGRSDRDYRFTIHSKERPPWRGGLLFLRHAYFAHCRGLHTESARLLAWAFEDDYTAGKFLFDKMAWKTFEFGVLALNMAGDRRLAQDYWNRVLTRFPGSDFEKQCRHYVRTLDRMIEEDGVFREQHKVSRLSDKRQAAYWVHELREVKVVQSSWPGHCSVFDFDSKGESPAHQLASLGKPAIPALIALLEDDRLTRAYGFGRPFLPSRWVLQYRDAAIQILQRIANESFSQSNSNSFYLSRLAPDRQAEVIAKVKAWWQKNKERNESAWLRESLDGQGIGYSSNSLAACRRLISLEGARSVGFFRQRLAAEPDNGWALEMLWQAGQSQVLPDVLRIARSNKLRRRVSAYRILQKAEHPQYLQLALDEYRALVETQELKGRDQRDAAESLTYLLVKSNDQSARDEVCCVLREGSTWMSIYSYDALERIQEPWVVPHLAGRLHDDRGHHLYRDSQRPMYRLSDRAARTLIARYKLPWKFEPQAPLAERDEIIEKVRKWWKADGENEGESGSS